MNTEQFIKQVNKTRKANKGKWYFITPPVQVNNKMVTLKGFNTWIQIMGVEDLTSGQHYKDSSPMELSVKGFNEWLTQAVERGMS